MIALEVDAVKREVRAGKWVCREIHYNTYMRENEVYLKLHILEVNGIAVLSEVNQDGIKAVQQEIVQYLGSRFYHRLRGACFSLWIAPIREICDRYCFYSNGFKHYYNKPQIRRYWLHQKKVNKVIDDRLDHLVPLVIYFGFTPKTLKRKLGKSTWKKLAANSLYKNKLIVEFLQNWIYDHKRQRPFGSFVRHQSLITALANINTTLIKNSGFMMDYHLPNYLLVQILYWLNANSKTSVIRVLRKDFVTFYDTRKMAIHLHQANRFNHKWSFKRMINVHSELCRVMLLGKYSDKAIEAIVQLNPVYCFNSVHIALLKTPLAIANEGREMHHCVASYIGDVKKGNYCVLSLSTEGKRADRSTLGICYSNGSWRIDQHEGVCGTKVNDDRLLSAAVRITEYFNEIHHP